MALLWPKTFIALPWAKLLMALPCMDENIYAQVFLKLTNLNS
jgi:hypothetical protein